ncbi:hypothetical protein [Kineosporia sp. NBRC 101731]|uniref:FlgD immunoglobulin-like domain containing protein n=1 Tax=Kineosporia sp. NBRC 101731 TaxID=3032199 RepID=UPI0024A4B3E4|nr:hypothetical protein [Kineosporia sp. NBRC 101731]GLY30713.1 hypothetical protein Kisp02_40780 [Kineosporia sp. NBRC 101731]
MAGIVSGPSASASENSTAVPLHRGPQLDVSLIGGSGEGYAVQAGVPYGVDGGLFTGTGGELKARTLPADEDPYGRRRWLGVIGQQAGYVITHPRTSSEPATYELHRLNVVSGSDSDLGTISVDPIGFTADGWLVWDGEDLVETRFDTGNAAVVATMPDLADRKVTGTALTTGAALVRSTNADQSESYLDLVEFGAGTIERVATETAADLHAFDLSPTTLVWWGRQYTGEPQYVKVRARSGGVVTTYNDTDDNADNSVRVPGQNSAAYVIPHEGAWKLRVISTSGGVSTLDLPDYSAGLIADGARWLLAASGRVANAGVYSVQDSTVTRVASVPALNISTSAVAFAAGRIYYGDNYYFDDGSTPLDARAPMAIWSRPVTGLGRPVLGDETELGQRSAHVPGGGDSIGFSAGRGVVSGVATGSTFTWRLLDRGRLTATVRQTWSYQPTGEMDTRYPNVSGPYLTAAGHVYDPTGKLVYSRPGAQTGIGGPGRPDDLYGPRLIYSTRNAKSGDTDVWVRDLDRRKSGSNPGKLASTRTYAPRVAIWGDLAAWQSGSREISLRRIGTTQIRRIRITGPLIQLTLGEGILAWNANARTYTLDTASASSRPTAYAGAGNHLALDDHYLARRVGTGAMVVYRSLYTEKYRPRLIGTFAPAGFTPNGDRRADSWEPQFDLSKPVTGVKLTLRSTKTGSVLRTLTGTGPDGSIRDLVFDGRNNSGKALANGTYSWQLTARAQDGEGALIGIRGETSVKGTVKISKSKG